MSQYLEHAGEYEDVAWWQDKGVLCIILKHCQGPGLIVCILYKKNEYTIYITTIFKKDFIWQTKKPQKWQCKTNSKG